MTYDGNFDMIRAEERLDDTYTSPLRLLRFLILAWEEISNQPQVQVQGQVQALR